MVSLCIGHRRHEAIGQADCEKIYTGKNIQVGEILVTAINAEVGSTATSAILRAFVGKTEDEYIIGRWLVMRAKGLGKASTRVFATRQQSSIS